MTKKVLLLISCLLFGFSSVKAQSSAPERLSSADLIYYETCGFHFKTVDSLLKLNQHMNSQDLAYSLATVNYYWWKLISAESNTKYAGLISEKIRTYEKVYNGSPKKISDPELFNLISIYAFKARVELKDYAYLAAINSLSRYYSFLKESFGKENDHVPFLLTSGLYYFFTGLVRERYPLFTPLLSPYKRGDILLGLYYLRKAANLGDWKTKQEAEYFLMKINYDIYKNYPESEKYCKSLLKRFPENLLYQQYLIRIYLASGQPLKAREVFSMLERSARSNNQLSNWERDHYISESRKEMDRYFK